MQKEMRELIETRKSPAEQLRNRWKEINDKLKESGVFGSSIFIFSKSLERAGIDNSKFERARKAYEKAGDDFTNALHDIKKFL